MYRLLNAHWITWTEAKKAMSLLEIYQAEEALDCWLEAQAIADATPPPKK